MLELPQLTKANYQRWKYEVVSTLESLDLAEVTDGTEKCPAGDLSSDEVKKWRKKDAQARRVLTSSLHDEDHAAVRDCKTSHQIWSKLVSIYESQTAHNKYLLNQELHRFKFQDGQTVASYCAGLTVIVEKLEVTGVKIDSSTLVAKLVDDLPPKFENFRQTYHIQVATGTELSFEQVRNQCQMIEATMTQENSVSGDNGEALVAKKRNGSQWAKQKKEDRKCFYCKRVGHLKKDCRKFKANQSVLANKTNQEVNTTTNGGGFMALTAVNMTSRDSWIADSGASKHMIADKSLFSTFKIINPVSITIGNGTNIKALAVGDIKIETFDGQKWSPRWLYDVWWVPEINYNLFSLSAVVARGFSIEMRNNQLKVIGSGRVQMIGERGPKNLFYVGLRIPSAAAYVSSGGSLQEWHERLGHVSVNTIKAMAKNDTVTGMVISSTEDFFCGGCAMGKMTRLTCKSTETKQVAVGEHIHADLFGPSEVLSIGGARYTLMLKDEGSCWRRVYFMTSKDQTLLMFKQFVAEMRAERNQIMKVFRSDNGTEFVNKEFRKYLADNKIKFEVSAPYTPQQNGRAEREIRTLTESGRSMIYSRSLPTYLWAEAVNTAAYVLNRTSAVGPTPYELWHGERPNVGHLRAFGAIAYARVANGQKWDPRSQPLILVGYTNTEKNFRLWNKSRHRVDVFKSVEFDWEQEVQKNSVTCNQWESEDEEVFHDEQQEKTRGRPKGGKNKVYEKVDRNLRSCGATLLAGEDLTYSDAINGDDRREWQAAMDEEMASLKENKTWVLMYLPQDRKAIDSRWVYQVKEKPSGEVARFKARLVAKGFTQRPNIDFGLTFAPVARMDSIRTVLALATLADMEMVHFDVKTAFLYGEITEELYMKQPEGYDDGSGRVCKLQKGLYGLKQSPRAWNKKIDCFLTKFGLERSVADPCVYFGATGNLKIMLALYVDDGLLCSNDDETISKVLDGLKTEFKIVVEDLSCFVGLQIERNRVAGTLKIHQSGYIKRILEKFKMTNARAIITPADVALKLEKPSPEEIVDVPYKNAVGSLMYAMCGTRPDIAYAVGKVAQFMSCPGKHQWLAVKNIYRYLKGTINRGIVYRRGTNFEVTAYTDSDWAGDQVKRCSTGGYIFTLAGGVVAWMSKLQKVQALSTCEAEYVAACETTKQAIWMRQLVASLGCTISKPITIYCDNQGTIKMIENAEVSTRNKHIDLRHHFIRDRQEDKIIKLVYIESEEQAADFMTKPLHGPAFNHCVAKVGMD